MFLTSEAFVDISISKSECTTSFCDPVKSLQLGTNTEEKLLGICQPRSSGSLISMYVLRWRVAAGNFKFVTVFTVQDKSLVSM